ncbi:MAG: LAGLIDADG family homing endonuclease, partial [Candidatus Nanohaloarchaea archaeon]
RKHIQEALEKAEEKGFEVVYGDSLPYDREVIVRDSSGKIEFLPIGELIEERNPQEYETLAFDIEDESVEFHQVERGISHSHEDELLRFDTNRGRTVVTPQHSVYTYDGTIELADASDLEEGDYLVSLTDTVDEEPIYSAGDTLDLAKLDYGRDYLRAYIDDRRFSSGETGECPYCGEEYYLASHVHSEHSDRKVVLEEAESRHEFIGGSNAKTGRIPRYWDITKELAWVLGYYCGDGSATKGGKEMISFGGQNRELLERVKDYFDDVLEESFEIIESTDERTGNKMYYYRIQRRPLVDLMVDGLGAGRGSAGKEVPGVILNGSKSLKRSFLEGYTDADGSIEKEIDERYSSDNVRFSTKSSSLANQVHYLLKQVSEGLNRYDRELSDVSYKYRADKPQIKSIRNTAPRDPAYSDWSFTPARINNKEVVQNEGGSVYDIEVQGRHNFVDAEGLILVHNTDSLFLKGENVEDRIDSFLEEVNQELPEFME